MMKRVLFVMGLSAVLAGCATDEPTPQAKPNKKIHAAMPKEVFDTVEDLKARADAGDAAAMSALGQRLVTGEGIEKDVEQGLDYIQKSADMGHPEGIFNLGVAYSSGFMGEKNESLAGLLFERAANLGNPNGQYWTGYFLWHGRGGFTKNRQAAVDFLLKSAEQGHPNAATLLGIAFATGDGVEQDYDKAAEWYRAANRMGFVQLAQFNLLALIADGKVEWQPGDPGSPPAENAE